jgi:hypothetical protein
VSPLGSDDPSVISPTGLSTYEMFTTHILELTLNNPLVCSQPLRQFHLQVPAETSEVPLVWPQFMQRTQHISPRRGRAALIA